MKPALPSDTERVRIVYWVLQWCRNQQKTLWSSRDRLRVSETTYDESRSLCWDEAKRIAQWQQTQSQRSILQPEKQMSTSPKGSSHTKPVVYPRVAHRYSKDKEKA